MSCILRLLSCILRLLSCILGFLSCILELLPCIVILLSCTDDNIISRVFQGRSSYKYMYKKGIKKTKFLIAQKFRLEVPTRFELVIKVLQTFALPLGYGTI